MRMLFISFFSRCSNVQNHTSIGLEALYAILVVDWSVGKGWSEWESFDWSKVTYPLLQSACGVVSNKLPVVDLKMRGCGGKRRRLGKAKRLRLEADSLLFKVS